MCLKVQLSIEVDKYDRIRAKIDLVQMENVLFLTMAKMLTSFSSWAVKIEFRKKLVLAVCSPTHTNASILFAPRTNLILYETG